MMTGKLITLRVCLWLTTSPHPTFTKSAIIYGLPLKAKAHKLDFGSLQFTPI